MKLEINTLATALAAEKDRGSRMLEAMTQFTKQITVLTTGIEQKGDIPRIAASVHKAIRGIQIPPMPAKATEEVKQHQPQQ